MPRESFGKWGGEVGEVGGKRSACSKSLKSSVPRALRPRLGSARRTRVRVVRVRVPG